LLITLGLLYYINEDLIKALIHDVFGGSMGAKYKRIPEFAMFPDKYETIDMVREALQTEGLESCNLIIGVDYTASNEFQGKRTFGGRCLHTIDQFEQNPYQKVISIIGKTLAAFDEDNLIPVYGFGDITTKDRAVFPFLNHRSCEGFDEVLEQYTQVTPRVKLSGPTNFAPIIDEAIKIVARNMEFHILLIIADGQVTNERATIKAIEKASEYPLSIVMVGVGDGPWDMMHKFDDMLPYRQFDNFQFVDYHSIMAKGGPTEARFALMALMEIPQQFNAIKRLGLLGK